MKVLVTGGCGYIGSHTTTLLLKENIDVVIIDNLSNSKIDVLDKIREITGKSVTFFVFNFLLILLTTSLDVMFFSLFISIIPFII